MQSNALYDNPENKPIHIIIIEVYNTKINYLLRTSPTRYTNLVPLAIDHAAEAAVYSEGNSVLCSKHYRQQL